MNKEESTLTPKDLEELNAAFATIDWEHLPGPFDELTADLHLREVTTDELAQVLGITDRRVSQLWHDGIIPVPRHDGKRYWFPLLHSVNCYIEYLRNK